MNKNIRLIYVDLFCGAGGTSTGVESARYQGEECAKVIACVNHDANAIASHAENHPDALHFTEDIRTLELSPMIEHIAQSRIEYPNALLVLWASLECTNFSRAKGGQPRDADSRTLAEHLFRYVDALNPDYIQIENVEEFMSWGDMDENNKPISKDKGKCYHRWVDSVKECGYKYDYRILNSANFGAYTARKRFFGIFAKTELPIVFPDPTHSKSGVNDIPGTSDKWKAVKEVLDFSDQGNSIFTRKKPLAENTMERIYAGLIKFVAGGKDNFLSRYNGGDPKHKSLSIDGPCGVLTTENRFAKVGVQFLSKYFSGHPESKNIPVDAPAHTIKCIDNHSLVQPKFLSAYYGNGHNHSVDSPAPTVTTRDRLAYINPSFLDMQYGNGTPASCDAPAPVVTTTPKHNLVNCYLMNPQFNSKGGDVDKPCFTLIARMDKMPPYLVSTVDGGVGIEVYDTDSPCTVKIKEFMAVYGIMDIMMRMLKIPELKQIMGFPKDYTLIGTQADQKKFIGNAVEVTMARVLCEALSKEIAKLEVKNAA